MIRGIEYHRSLATGALAAVSCALAVAAWDLRRAAHAQESLRQSTQVVKALRDQSVALAANSEENVKAARDKAAAFRSRLVDDTVWEDFAKRASLDPEWTVSITTIPDVKRPVEGYEKRRATLGFLSTGVAEWPKIMRVVEAADERNTLFGVGGLEIHSAPKGDKMAFEKVRIEVVYFAPKSVNGT